MTAFVFDFKDINSRMKGDLLERKEPSRLCPKCNGKGRYQISSRGTPIFEVCPDCEPQGIKPIPALPRAMPMFCCDCRGIGSNPLTGKLCNRCNGSGLAP